MKTVLSCVLILFLVVVLLVQCVPQSELGDESETTVSMTVESEPLVTSKEETTASDAISETITETESESEPESTTGTESVAETETETETETEPVTTPPETKPEETKPKETKPPSTTAPDLGPKDYIGDHFGITREDVVAELAAHEQDDFYLTTPYQPRDWSSPNGDPSYNGEPGMNCGGFVGYVVKQAGMDLSALDQAVRKSGYWFSWIRHSSNSWYLYIKNYRVYSYQFPSKEALLASGLAQKGDIVLTWHAYQTTAKHDNHIGFFWGNSPDEDLMWHSSPKDGENVIGPLTAASTKSVWYLIPLSETRMPDDTSESEDAVTPDNTTEPTDTTESGGEPEETLPEPEETETSSEDTSSAETEPPETDTEFESDTPDDSDSGEQSPETTTNKSEEQTSESVPAESADVDREESTTEVSDDTDGDEMQQNAPETV